MQEGQGWTQTLKAASRDVITEGGRARSKYLALEPSASTCGLWEVPIQV